VIGADANGCTDTTVFVQTVTVCPGTATIIPFAGRVSCIGKKDAHIALYQDISYTPRDVKYFWSDSTQCPMHNCDTLKNVGAGNYSVLVTITYTLNNTLVKTDSIRQNITVEDGREICGIKVFKGVTPNNDGVNDTWIIENIADYPKNHVTIYNRWGEAVSDITGYNNTTKVWPLGAERSSLQSSTYFYIIDLGDSSKPVKGWVEVVTK
jgi:gliding motility-associated-like protein